MAQHKDCDFQWLCQLCSYWRAPCHKMFVSAALHLPHVLDIAQQEMLENYTINSKLMYGQE
jgi:hypothetical protein